MGEKHVPDLKTLKPSILQVLVNFALRIDDRSATRFLIPYQIGGVCETAQVVLFEDHRSLTFLES